MAAAFGAESDCLKIELLAMKEYGIEGSWTKQYCLDVSGLLYVHRNSLPKNISFGVGFDGELIVYTSCRLLVLHPTGEESDVVFAHHTIPYDARVINYRESLLRINQD